MSEMRSHACFAGLVLLGTAVYFFPIGALAKLVFENETYSHISLIPLVSLFLLVVQRKSIFAGAGRSPAAGLAVCAGGLVLYGLATVLREHLGRLEFRNQDVPNDYLTLCMAGWVTWVIGSFIAVYGTHAFKKARFALLFLVFAIPIPVLLLERVITALQHASAEAADIVFRLTGAPYHRSGLVFEFPNLTIRVAEECSGIRSSLSLFILSIITGYLFLRTFSRRAVLALAIFPITVVKNAFRIVTITLLANYVDLRFITNHWIHRSGGIPFFAVAMAMFIPLVWALKRTEGPGASRPASDAGQGGAEDKKRISLAQGK
jgi:exosortase